MSEFSVARSNRQRTIRIIDCPAERPACPKGCATRVAIVWLPRFYRCPNCGTTFEVCS